MKRFILDTNVILDDANFLNQFDEGIVIIPITVIEELDNFKRNMNNLGRNARHFSNLLDEYRDNKGNISKKDGIKIKASGGIRTREFALELIEAGADRLGTSNTEKILFG